MKKYDESALILLLQEFGTPDMLTVKGISEAVFFRECSQQVFHSL